MLKIELLGDRGIAVLSPEGKLEAADFERVGQEIDPFIEAHGRLERSAGSSQPLSRLGGFQRPR